MPDRITKEPATISSYLLDQLAAAGVRHVFGVPGDYNLTFLDQIVAHPDLEWIGAANELNAAYMADGYARLHGLSAVVTTYGVGELSAMNGIAGAYAEHVPVLHIVGTPSTQIQRDCLPVHHSLLDGRHDHFTRAFAEVSAAVGTLNEHNAADEIDRILAAILTEKRPGYLALPSNLVGRHCPAPTPPTTGAGPGDQSPGPAFTDAATALLGTGKRVAVVVDQLARRHDVGAQIDALVRKAGLPVAVTTAGKGTINESTDTFLGLYLGAISETAARTGVEDADVIIGIGLVRSDLSTGGFTANLAGERLIDIQPYRATVGTTEIDGLTMSQAIDQLAEILAGAHPETGAPPAKHHRADPESIPDDTPLDQALLWHQLGEFLEPDDVVAADQGTSFYGLLGLRLPAGVEVVAQPLWSSIGYTIPAIAGAQLAAGPGRRAILVVGDGAAQLTVQELGTIARLGLDPIVVLVNNDGYTVERAINGWTAPYNDIAPWDWQRLPAAFGARDAIVERAQTIGELRCFLEHAREEPGRLRLVEVTLGRHDLPLVLQATAQAVARRNATTAQT